jgi:alginate O-acetyltransferase complex protein AlgI
MLFCSNIFLFYSLPVLLILYFGITIVFKTFFADNETNRIRILNVCLVIFSLLFYFWGSGKFIDVFLFSIFINWLIGSLISHSARPKIILLLGISINLLILFYFKYYYFFYQQVSIIVTSCFHAELQPMPKIFLPIGISFYTFMAISYLVEVYRRTLKPVSLLQFGTFLTLFPHLVAGPIVRYSDIQAEISARKATLDLFFEGIWRFAVGLGKKVILANTFAEVADKIFVLPNNELTASLAWIGVVCYTLQIYFDFSGYSDMAIGLARFFCFHFPENFNNPYQSKTVTEFWQRWHMTLSKWFRDYLYIPLGGNRKGTVRTYVNLFIVFFLCGLWHGASWTFVFWGIYQGVILVVERILLNRYNFKMKGFIGNIATMLFVMIGWVFFRSSTFTGALHYLQSMFGLSQTGGFLYYDWRFYLNNAVIVYLITAVAIIIVPSLKMNGFPVRVRLFDSPFWKGTVSLALLMISILYLSKSHFTPFIYFQF